MIRWLLWSAGARSRFEGRQSGGKPPHSKGATFGATAPGAIRTSRHHRRSRLLDNPPAVNRTSPAMMTVWARPRTSPPPKGALRLLERNCVGSTVQRTLGSTIVTIVTNEPEVVCGSRYLLACETKVLLE